MTISPTILDWPHDVVPNAAMFHAGGMAIENGYMLGGAASLSPEPGGRAALEMTFSYLKGEAAARRGSWLMSRIRNGQVFRLPLRYSPQIVSATDLGLSVTLAGEQAGTPWSNGESWSNGQNWLYEPGAAAASASLEGSTSVVLDMSVFPTAGLAYGHVIGQNKDGISAAYHVDDVSYDGSVATLTVSPPLRRAVAVDDFITFRPYMLGTAIDPDSFRSLFDAARRLQPGSVAFMESLL